jgi:hypothetical protein
MPVTLRLWLKANTLAIAFVLLLTLAIGGWYSEAQKQKQKTRALIELSKEMVVNIIQETERVIYETQFLKTESSDYQKASSALQILIDKEQSYLENFSTYEDTKVANKSEEFLRTRLEKHRSVSIWLLTDAPMLSNLAANPSAENEAQLRTKLTAYKNILPTQEQKQIDNLLNEPIDQWKVTTWPQPTAKLTNKLLLTTTHEKDVTTLRNEIQSLEETIN